ncbi:MAG: (d)CMP kinase [bacterium]
MTSRQDRRVVVAIDGPSASGKSTIGRLIASRLGLRYIDTGAMYRAIAWLAKYNNISWHNENEVVLLLEKSPIIVGQDEDEAFIKIGDFVLKDQLRTQMIGEGASIISSHEKVKFAMIAKQREIAQQGGVVMDGRDIGTYVFPEADIKFFLYADVRERARRRCRELEEKSDTPVFDTIFQEIQNRDTMDMNRKTAPLKKAQDAISIDTTDLSITQVGEVMLKEISNVLNTMRGTYDPDMGRRGGE